MSGHPLLERAAGLLGLETAYVDTWGKTRPVAEDVQRALIAALGLPSDDDTALARALDDVELRPWRRALDPVTVVRNDRPPIDLAVTVPAAEAGRSIAWTLMLEDGERRESEVAVADLPLLAARQVDGRAVERRLLRLGPSLPAGYHRIAVASPGAEACEAALIVSPGTCYLPPALDDGARVWGVSLQLYGVRSRRNWGIGDFTDLARLAGSLAGQGCAAIGINPLHALFAGNPWHTSPYGPSSRRFRNVLYIDVEAVPEFRHCAEARAHVAADGFQRELERLRAEPLVDYPGVAAAKLPVLEMLYRTFRERHLAGRDRRANEFRRYRERGGEALRAFAVFETLAEHFGGDERPDYAWRGWPEALRDCGSAAVQRFAADHESRVTFHEYLQWTAERQFARSARASDRAGMAVGIYRDLAVGFDSNGAEAWTDRALLVEDATIGAPPDPLNLHGQNWGVPPFHPDRLHEAEYRPFVGMLRSNMRNGGALRIDHVLGLYRLYWVPRGGDGAAGGYVRNRFEDLLGIIALESRRNRCLVIGEDLGTVPEGFRERLAEARILSYRLAYFERDEAGAPAPPDHYPALALAAVGTHDLPTLPGFWTGHDIDLRSRLGLFPTPEMETEERAARERDRRDLVRLLAGAGLVPLDMSLAEPIPPPPELVRAIYAWLARTPARLVIFHPEDALGTLEQINLPGTMDEHPNWRRKLPILREAFARDRRLAAIFACLREARGEEARSTPFEPPVERRIAGGGRRKR